jgi:hypothetical protein
VIAAALAVLWLKPLISRLMKEQKSLQAQEAAVGPTGVQAASITGAVTK